VVAVLTGALAPAPAPAQVPPPTTGAPPTAAPTTTTTPATAPTAAATTTGPPLPPDRRLTVGLDGVVALSPPDMCLAVAIDGEVVYRHAADASKVPASTEKLLTGMVALDRLGADHRFHTAVVAPAPAAGGVVTGDLTLVGSGDPLLTTNVYRFVRAISADQPLTSLDTLADRVKAAGITRITGRVVGDESRYDGLRTVPSWPDRYQREKQVGPLSALSVDDGFVVHLPAPGTDDPVRRDASWAPAVDAAATFTELLRARGIAVDGQPAQGVAPAGAVEVAAIDSAPLGDVVTQMLQHSDNGTAELLTKEIGRVAGGAGTTAAGVTVIARRAAELGVPMAGSMVVDGSGLDPANHATCDELVGVLDASGGIDGPVGAALPVAGRTGTLAKRFRTSAAAGRLRAKTGTLNNVTSLAGFVALPEGGTATFAYIVNGRKTDQIMRGQEFLGDLLGQYVPPCAPGGDASLLIAPISPYLAGTGLLGAVPLAAVALPGTAIPLAAFEDRAADLVPRCVAAADGFGVVLR
jgi:D-alanyl-D-alanine carboxypeptidase/D-alanyl-D-alanine-endopeptidase (penicillin-binding protein 4)